MIFVCLIKKKTTQVLSSLKCNSQLRSDLNWLLLEIAYSFCSSHRIVYGFDCLRYYSISYEFLDATKRRLCKIYYIKKKAKSSVYDIIELLSATPAILARGGGCKMLFLINFVFAIAAEVTAHYICKWLDCKIAKRDSKPTR